MTTSSGYPDNALNELSAWRQRSPDAEAVVVYDVRRSREAGKAVRRDSVTTTALWNRVVAVAAGLQAHGVREGDIVAIQLPNWVEYLAVFLAVYAIGAISTPISPILRQRDVRRQLDISGASTLVVPSAFGHFDFLGMAQELQAELGFPLIVSVGVGPQRGGLALEAVEQEGAQPERADERGAIARGRFIRKADDVMVINFTSGTTGVPKGVMHSLHSVSSCVIPTIERLQLRPTDVAMVVPTLGHGAGILNGLYLPILLGAKVVYLDGWDARVALEVIARERVTYAPVMPTYLVDLAEQPSRFGGDIECWHTGRVSGGAIPRQVMQRIEQRMPSLRLCPGWGMSETLWSTCGGPDDPVDRRNGTDGRPVGDCQIEIRGKDFVQVLPAGEEGEIVLKASSLMLGYFRQPELTSQSFTDDGWFKTGDLGRLDADGYLTVMGRSKDLIIRGGENVPVVEVEALLQQHPKVKAVAVVGVPDARLGEKVCAVVEPRTNGDALAFEEMTRYLTGRQLTTQFIPEYLLVVPELPRTPVGKLMKQSIRELASDALVVTHPHTGDS